MTCLFRLIASNNRGTVSAEAALGMSLILLPICAGAADCSTAITTHARLDTAMQSVMMALWSNPSITTSAVQSVASSSWGGAAPKLTSTVSAAACYCLPPGGSYQTTAVVSCSSSCSSSQTLATYSIVTLTTSVTLPVPLPAMPSPMTLSVSAVIRIK